MTDNLIYKHDPNIVSRKIEDEMILLPIRSNVADMAEIYTLNETAAAVWAHVDGIKTMGQIRAAILEEFDVEAAALEQDLSELIKGLLDVGALVQVTG